MTPHQQLDLKLAELLEAFGNRKTPDYARFVASLYSLQTIGREHHMFNPIMSQLLDALAGLIGHDHAMEVVGDFNMLVKIQTEMYDKYGKKDNEPPST